MDQSHLLQLRLLLLHLQQGLQLPLAQPPMHLLKKELSLLLILPLQPPPSLQLPASHPLAAPLAGLQELVTAPPILNVQLWRTLEQRHLVAHRRKQTIPPRAWPVQPAGCSSGPGVHLFS